MTIATDLDRLAIDTIRTLSIDGVQKANSGRPGAPGRRADGVRRVDAVPAARRPLDWPNRDRFVLSAGHASMRSVPAPSTSAAMGSRWRTCRPSASGARAHPAIEYGLTPGVEATTGPLGQGFANGVGMAVANAASRLSSAAPTTR